MLKVFEFTPTALNAANDTSASSFTDSRTGYPLEMGGLTLGDCFDLDERTANSLSNTIIGTLHEGRYRRIYVDAGATAANVQVGTAAYLAIGASIYGGIVLTPGSGQTPGTYNVSATGGGGFGAILQVIVTPAGTVTAQPTVIAAGGQYTTTPTFTLAAGGTPATFQAQTSLSTYNVTSADKALTLNAPRGVFLNPVTPGRYAWIQENGIATVTQAATVTSGTIGAIVTPTANGTMQSTVGTAAALASYFGIALDIPAANSPYRVLLDLPTWNG